jgi:hypothetical protein
MMPGMTGRARGLSGDAASRASRDRGDPTLTEAARQMGVTNFLKKPIDPVELVKAVERQCADLGLSSMPPSSGHVTTH